MPGLLAAQPVRYPPLTYFVAAVFAEATNWWPGFYALTILFFSAITLLAMALLGRCVAGDTWLALLPVAALITVPTFWEIAGSYNLEPSLVAGVAAFFLAMFYADRLRSYWLLIPVSVAIGILALSKAVFLVFIMPAALVLVFAEPAKRLPRMMMFGGVIAVAGFWFLVHRHVVQPELAVDLSNAFDPGFWYYVRVLLSGYRGLPLFIALGIVLWWRWRARAWRWDDLAFAAWFFAPLVFYFIIDTKRAWYILPAYLAVPVWFASTVRDFLVEKRGRLLGAAVVAVYLVSAVAHLGLVVYAARTPDRPGRVIGVKRPEPPTPLEKAVVAAVLEDLYADPRSTLIVNPAGYDHFFRISNLLPMTERRLYIQPQAAVINPFFILSFEGVDLLARTTRLYRIDQGWPVVDPDGISVLREGYDYEKLAREMAALSSRFHLQRKQELPGGHKLMVFEQNDPVPTYRVNGLNLYEDYTAELLAAKQRQDWFGALAVFAKLRGVAVPDQIPGIKLEQVQVLSRLDRRDEAVVLLQENLSAATTEPVRSESALLLARLQAESGRAAAAHEALAAIEVAHLDPLSLAAAIGEIARRLPQADQGRALIQSFREKMTGEPAVELLMALGKLELDARRDAQALAQFQQARAQTTDPGRRAWLDETITAIERGEHRPPQAE